ncbi:MAG: hypothetical protein ABIP48_25510 [Planctomycetota bacterium]
MFRLARFLPWLGPIRFLASVRLAVVVISLSTLVLGWATYVDSRYGAKAVHFGIYSTWWFAGLMGLLGLNVLSAALIRFPWKKHQTGFLITHAGIVFLLVGCLLSWLGGVDAQLPVFEGGRGSQAYEDTQHFELKVYRQRPGGAPATAANSGDHPAAGDNSTSEIREESNAETIEIPFAAGPFNWTDCDQMFWFPWRLSRRDRGVLYQRDGIKLEVLDYLSDSTFEPAGVLELRAKGRSNEWTTVALEIQGTQGPNSAFPRMGASSRRALPGEEWIVFWPADGPAETDAFRNSRPAGPLGSLGQVVLWAGGASHHLAVDDLRTEKRLPLGDTGMEAEFVQFDPTLLRLVLRIHPPDSPTIRMVLYAEIPELNQQGREYGVFGTWWFDTGSAVQGSESAVLPEMRKLDRPRVDILQGADEKLYYRTWSSPELGAIAELPADGAQVTAFEQTGSPVTLYVEQFTPHDKPGFVVRPAPFVKQEDKKTYKLRQARVRLTVDGNRDEFWLLGRMKEPTTVEPGADHRKVVQGKNRRAAITLVWDRVDVGFQLYLRRFQRKLDPGTSMASHYSSLVDLVDRHDETKLIETEVLITLNEPVNFSDPRTGRSYRVFQESFAGPFKPGEPIFEENVDPASPRDELFLSWLTVNYDPGRGMKYTGSLMIVAGIAAMFYMRAHFFRKRPVRDQT